MEANEDARILESLLKEEFGFKDITVEPVSLPEYLVDWINEEQGEDGEPHVPTEGDVGLTYLRARTKKGSFGILVGVYPMLDFKGTGLDPGSLGEEFPPDVFLCGFDDEPVRRLRDLLEPSE